MKLATIGMPASGSFDCQLLSAMDKWAQEVDGNFGRTYGMAAPNVAFQNCK